MIVYLCIVSSCDFQKWSPPAGREASLIRDGSFVYEDLNIGTKNENELAAFVFLGLRYFTQCHLYMLSHYLQNSCFHFYLVE